MFFISQLFASVTLTSFSSAYKGAKRLTSQTPNVWSGGFFISERAGHLGSNVSWAKVSQWSRGFDEFPKSFLGTKQHQLTKMYVKTEKSVLSLVCRYELKTEKVKKWQSAATRGQNWDGNLGWTGDLQKKRLAWILVHLGYDFESGLNWNVGWFMLYR